MRQHILAVAFFGSLLVNGAAFAGGASLQNIPLQWKPTSILSEMGTIDLSGGVITTKIRFDPLVDTRQNPPLVAENREKPNVRPMTTSSDVAVFVTDHLKDSVHGAGLNVVDGDATRWGRSYKAENYYEVMSDMLLRATYNLLSNEGFRTALAKH